MLVFQVLSDDGFNRRFDDFIGGLKNQFAIGWLVQDGSFEGHFPDDLVWSIPTDWGGGAQTQQVERGISWLQFQAIFHQGSEIW